MTSDDRKTIGNFKRYGGKHSLRDLTAKADLTEALKTGDVITDGPNTGWIYCEGKDVKPFIVAPKDSGVMKWREAMDYAARENSELPSRNQLNAMYEARVTGALRGTFNKTGSDPAGWYWSSTQEKIFASCKSFGGAVATDYYTNKDFRSSVRCVRPYTPAL